MSVIAGGTDMNSSKALPQFLHFYFSVFSQGIHSSMPDICRLQKTQGFPFFFQYLLFNFEKTFSGNPADKSMVMPIPTVKSEAST